MVGPGGGWLVGGERPHVTFRASPGEMAFSEVALALGSHSCRDSAERPPGTDRGDDDVGCVSS